MPLTFNPGEALHDVRDRVFVRGIQPVKLGDADFERSRSIAGCASLMVATAAAVGVRV
jgi:hypothetical protein